MVATQIALQQVRVGLKSLPPGLLMNSKRKMERDEQLAAGKKGVKCSPAEEAELHCHWTTVGKKKQLAFPWVGFYKALCDAARTFKYGKSSMATLVAATISCDQDFLPLGTDQYEVYQEWVRIPPRTGAMVKIARPRLAEWSTEFTLSVDAELYGKGVAMLEPVIAHAGRMVGIGPWRPSLKGPYGKFALVKFEVL
jgi:hypothetical protein